MENNNRQGCRWTKASERLPDMEKVVYLKDNVGLERLGNFYEVDDGYDEKVISIWLYIQPNGAHEGFRIQQKNFNHYFWLDESIEPCATSSEKLVYVPCDENDERAVGGFTSTDGRSLCYVRECHINSNISDKDQRTVELENETKRLKEMCVEWFKVYYQYNYTDFKMQEIVEKYKKENNLL
jgi:hypothetical protein